MKTWALSATGATAIATLLLAACGSSTGSGATAGTGAGTTVTVGHSSSGATVASGTGASTSVTTGSGGTAAGTCTAPSTIADCGKCATQTACDTCASTVDQPGVMDYNNLVNCIFCDACYTTCDGAAELGMMGGCTAAPTMKDACDIGAQSTTTCGTCQMCSTKAAATCSAEDTACSGNSQCADLLTNLYNTCHGLPM